MQTVIQVITGSTSSLRDRITGDEKRLAEFEITLGPEKKLGRTKGWAKLYSKRGSGFGALNLSWDASTKTLVGRVINRGKGRPDAIVGDFTAYLLSRFRGKIRLIQIFQT